MVSSLLHFVAHIIGYALLITMQKWFCGTKGIPHPGIHHNDGIAPSFSFSYMECLTATPNMPTTHSLYMRKIILQDMLKQLIHFREEDIPF